MAILAGALPAVIDQNMGSLICELIVLVGEKDRLIAALTPALRPFARVSPAWRLWLTSIGFDANAARRLPEAGHLVAFNGTALAQLRAAARAKPETLSTCLESAAHPAE